mgnify:CR=1 FL=1
MRIANKGDLPALTALWARCFGDEEAEIEAFWDFLFPDITVFLTEEKTAMAVAMPAFLGQSRSAYLYAVCTAPASRGKGLCRNLIQFAEQQLRQMGIESVFLVPGEPSLFDFYASLGYETCCFCRCFSAAAAEKPERITEVSAAEYAALRRAYGVKNQIEYPERLLQWQQKSGLLLKVGDFGCAAAVKSADGFSLREVLGETPERAAGALAAYFGAETILARTAGNQPFGMGKPLLAKPLPSCYLGLAFE